MILKHDGWYFVQSDYTLDITIYDDQMRERWYMHVVPRKLNEAEALEYLADIRRRFDNESKE